MTNFPVRQHYVPQFYLRHFANAEGRVHFYDKITNEADERNTKSLAYKKDFYTLDVDGGPLTQASYDIERELGEKYENAHAIILQRVLTALDQRPPQLTNEDKAGLAELTAIQLVRTPRFRGISRTLAEREALSPGTTYTADQFLKASHTKMLQEESFIRRVSTTLGRRKIRILQVPGTVPLITSDVPVITALADASTGKLSFTESQGIGLNNSEVYIPISTRNVLVFFREDSEIPDFQLQIMNDSYAEEFNKMMWACADRQVFSPLPLVPPTNTSSTPPSNV